MAHPWRIEFPDDNNAPIVTKRDLGWLTVSGGLTKARARALLTKRWKRLEKPLAGLRDRLLESEPVAVVRDGEAITLELRRKAATSLARGDEVTYLIQAPTTATAIRKSLRARGIEPDSLMIAFLVAFDGLHDQAPPWCGHFVPHAQWKTIAPHCAEWGERWKDHHVIYHALSGDQLLCSNNGRIGWYILPESRYQPYWRSFGAFIRFYCRFQDFFYPLDSYATGRVLNR